jgi:hypothetical protein
MFVVVISNLRYEGEKSVSKMRFLLILRRNDNRKKNQKHEKTNA